MNTLDTIILVGGKGTRLQGVISDLPKPLAPVNGRPFLDIILSQLSNSGMVGKVILSAGYMADKVVEKYNESKEFGFDISVSVEETPLGTGGAIKFALNAVSIDPVLVMNGDSFCEFDLKRLYAEHSEKRADLSMVLREVPDAGRFGSVEVSADGQICAFNEKICQGEKGLINAGIYLINKDIFNGKNSGEVFSFERDLLPDLIGKKRIFGQLTTGKFIDIGTPESYAKICHCRAYRQAGEERK